MERYSAVQDGHSGGRHGDTAGSTQLPQRHAAVTGDGLFRAQGAQGIGEPGIGVTGQIDVGGSTLDKGTAGCRNTGKAGKARNNGGTQGALLRH